MSLRCKLWPARCGGRTGASVEISCQSAIAISCRHRAIGESVPAAHEILHTRGRLSLPRLRNQMREPRSTAAAGNLRCEQWRRAGANLERALTFSHANPRQGRIR